MRTLRWRRRTVERGRRRGEKDKKQKNYKNTIVRKLLACLSVLRLGRPALPRGSIPVVAGMVGELQDGHTGATYRTMPHQA